MIGLIRNLRYAVRALARSPSFTVPVILTLALGIGAATLIFSVVNGFLLRPLPYPDQDRLVDLRHAAPDLGLDGLFASPAIYFTYRDQNESFESVGLWDWDNSPVTVVSSGTPESVQSLEVTHEVLGMLGADPVLGRTFTSADDQPGSSPTVVLSYGFWQRHFGGASPVGQTLRVAGVAHEVIGVLPEQFSFFEYPAEIFYPLRPRRATATFPGFDGRAIVRLKDGVTVEEANADVGRMIPLVSDAFPSPPGFSAADFQLVPRVRLLKESVIGELSGTLWTLMGTVMALLLIAVANVANLALVRLEARRRDLAIRATLGAGQAGVAKVVLSEAAVLGTTATALGMLAAYTALPAALAMGMVDLPEVMDVGIDASVLLFAATAALVAIAALALIPIIQLASSRRPTTLNLGRRSIGIGRKSARMRNSLLVAQVAIALLLLVGSGLMIRTFVALRDVDPGFANPDSIQTFQVALSQADARSIGQAVRTHQTILDRLASLPGVERVALAAFSDGLPMDGDGRSAPIYVDSERTPGEATANAAIGFVSPDFFEVLSTPLLAGRSFDWNDAYQERPVALISENFARSEWGSAASALGGRIGIQPSGPWFEVVGVVGDIRYDGLTQPAPESVSFPVAVQETRGGTRTATFIMRSERSGTPAFIEEIRRAIWSVNESLSVANVRTLGALYEDSMGRQALALRVLVAAGCVALLLGLVGIYGVYSYAVSRRSHEIGIRMAVGAKPSQLRRMFLKDALVLTGIGTAFGLVAAMVSTRFISSQLFGISPVDPATYVASSLLLISAGVLASYVPARRASALDPVPVLARE